MSAPLVVDASLVVEIVLEEPASKAIEAYLYEGADWHPLIGPTILASETAAAITKKVRRKELSAASAREAFGLWQGMLADSFVELTPANDLLDAAFDLSLSLHHPLHDCLYLALARSRSAAIATRDAILARKARELELHADLIRP